MRRKLTIAVVSICVLTGLKAQDLNVLGGYLGYWCIGQGDFHFLQYVYLDCQGSAPPGTMELAVFNSTGNLTTLLTMQRAYAVQLPHPLDTCQAPSTLHCVIEVLYEGMVHLPASAGGYNLTSQICCLSPHAVNLNNPSSGGLTFHAAIPDPAIGCNDAPYFGTTPVFVTCSPDSISYDHSAFDPDGDSLVYSLCAARTASSLPGHSPPPYPSVSYKSGYTAQYPMGTNSPVEIDSSTGLFTAQPVGIGCHVIAVCVDEYRNGVLIGQYQRPFITCIVECIDTAIAQLPDTIFTCVGEALQFPNQSTGAHAFHWNFGTGNPGDTSKLAFPSFTYPSLGTYTATMIVNRGLHCADTTQTTVAVLPPPVVDLGVDTMICDGDVVMIGVGSTQGTFLWSTGETTHQISVDTAGTYWVEQCLAPNCCDRDTIKVTVVSVSASMSGLKATYLTTDPHDTLTGTPPGGAFSGNGMTGDVFDPALAGVGTHKIYYTFIDVNGCVGMDSMTTIVSVAPGITAHRELEVSIIPTPNDGWFDVRLRLPRPSPMSIRIHDPLGRVVEERAIKWEQTINETFDLRFVSAGVYLIVVTWNEGEARERILITK